MAANYLRLTYEIHKANLAGAMEYRFSFLLQVARMMLNNTGFIIVWVIFFDRFPAISGWGLDEIMLLFAIIAIGYGILFSLGGGLRTLAKDISEGGLDYYLSFPKNVLWHVSVSRLTVSAVGDIAYGFVLLAVLHLRGALDLWQFLIFLGTILPVSLIMYSFFLIVQSMAFFFGQFADAAGSLFDFLLGLSLYPQSVFSGALKVAMYTILPAYFIVGIPVSLIKSFNLSQLLQLVAASIIFFVLGIFVFYRGLRRYESGNLITVRI